MRLRIILLVAALLAFLVFAGPWLFFQVACRIAYCDM
jgi:hypothetical protein